MKIVFTGTQHLFKDGDSGIYYARIKIGGKQKNRSLETKVATTAKLRLQDKLKEIREECAGENATGPLEVNAKFSDAADLYTAEVKNDPRLAEASKDARLRPLATLRRTWPELFGLEMRKITAVSIKNYMGDFERGKWPYLPTRAKAKTVAGNSASSVNKMVMCLKNVFEVAVKAHIITRNPAAELTYKAPKKKLLNLPNKPQFAKIIHHIRTKAGRGRIAGDLVEGLSYSGLRLEEANTLLWVDLDYERRMMTVNGTKTDGSARVIPMTNAFHDLSLRMKDRRENVTGAPVNPQEKVFEAQEAITSLARACEAVGVKKMTHHDLRHLFATTCIESGVDVPTVSSWLGHADGGALAMKTYGHIRPAHSTEAAKKVQFS
jgi:site-specific recombinase XerD